MIPNKKQILKYHFVETTQSTESVRRTLEIKAKEIPTIDFQILYKMKLKATVLTKLKTF